MRTEKPRPNAGRSSSRPNASRPPRGASPSRPTRLPRGASSASPARSPRGTAPASSTRPSRGARPAPSARPARGAAPALAQGRIVGSNRDWILFALFLAVALVVCGRLFYLQIIEAEAMSEQASQQRTISIVQQPRRGTIYDREGNPLAMSVEATTIYANPRETPEPAKTAYVLAQVLGGQAEEYREALEQDTTFVYIRRQADVVDAERLQKAVRELASKATPAEDGSILTLLSGIHFLPDSKRVYPNGQTGAQIIGTVDVDNNGLSGLELMYDNVLRGTPGSLISEQGKDGTPIPGGVIEQVAPIDGQDIIVSVDIELQQHVEAELARMGEERATDNGNVLVLDGATGEIYAAASLPLYDPNRLTQEAVDAGATELKGISFAYEPGSIFKATTAAAALEEGIMTPADELDVPASLTIGEHTVSDAYERGAQTMSLRTIIAQSSNVGISLVEQQVSDERYASYLERFGFGQPTHVDYPGESLGLLAPVNEWAEIHAATISFGQGLTVTSLQMASFYGAIANDGLRCQPHFLIDRPQSQTHQDYDSEQIMETRTADMLTDMLTSVTTEGTGHAARVEGYAIAGKTGTAEKASEDGSYLADNYIVSFVGFFAESESKLVCITSMDNPLGAEGNAPTGPLFSEIMQFAATRYMIEPNA